MSRNTGRQLLISNLSVGLAFEAFDFHCTATAFVKASQSEGRSVAPERPLLGDEEEEGNVLQKLI